MTESQNANISSFVVWYDSAPRPTNSNSSDVRQKLGIDWVGQQDEAPSPRSITPRKNPAKAEGEVKV